MGFHSHVEKIKEYVVIERRKVWRLRESREDNKRKLFKALISSILPAPLQ